MAIQRISKDELFSKDSQNARNNFILRVMEEEFGYTAAHSIIEHVVRTSMKSKAEIFANYDTFARILKEVYTEKVAEKEILDRLSSFGLSKKI